MRIPNTVEKNKVDFCNGYRLQMLITINAIAETLMGYDIPEMAKIEVLSILNLSESGIKEEDSL